MNTHLRARITLVSIFALGLFFFGGSALTAEPKIQSVKERRAQLVAGENKPKRLTLIGKGLADIKQVQVMLNNKPQDKLFNIQLDRATRNSRAIRITAKSNATPSGDYKIVAIGRNGEKIAVPAKLSLVNPRTTASRASKPVPVSRNTAGNSRVRADRELALRQKGVRGKGSQPQMADTVKIVNFKINGGSGSTNSRNVVLYHNQ